MKAKLRSTRWYNDATDTNIQLQMFITTSDVLSVEKELQADGSDDVDTELHMEAAHIMTSLPEGFVMQILPHIVYTQD